MVPFKKTFQCIGLILILLTLTACPDEEPCTEGAAFARKIDLIQIIPLQTIYNEGDIITLKTRIPAQNNFFGNQVINLFEQTNDYSARLVLSSDKLFTGNQLTFIKGFQGENSNWMEVEYNSTTNFYELEIKIKLNKIGNYSIVSIDRYEFQGDDKCNIYTLGSNIEGVNSDSNIVFTVQ